MKEVCWVCLAKDESNKDAVLGVVMTDTEEEKEAIKTWCRNNDSEPEDFDPYTGDMIMFLVEPYRVYDW